MTWKEQYNQIKAYTEKIASTCRVAQPPYIMQIHVLSIHTCQIEKHSTSTFFQSYFVNNTTFIQVINITDHICIKLEKKEHYPAKVWATGVLPVTGASCHQCPVTALAVYKSGAPTVQSILYSFSSIIKKYSRELTKNLNINPNQLVYG